MNKIVTNIKNKTAEIIDNKPLGLVIVILIPLVVLVLSGFMIFKGGGLGKSFDWILYIGRTSLGESDDQNAGEIQTEVLSAFEESLKPIYADPEKMYITKQNLDNPLLETSIEKVGVDNNGVMETPGSWETAGWYYKSAKPGEPGNLIINGHFDNNYGGPAAFWQLKNVEVGDKVSVVDRYGKNYIYETKETFLVSIEDPNRLDVLESEDGKSTLTLITCGGIWLPGKSTYDKRLIVKADLVQQAEQNTAVEIGQ